MKFLLLLTCLNLCLLSSSAVNFERVRRIREFEESKQKLRLSTRRPSSPKFIPGSKAGQFKVSTLNGILKYPSSSFNESSPILFHSFNWDSAFLQCLWNCTGSLEGLVEYSPENVYYVFMSKSKETAFEDALWMRNRITQVAQELLGNYGSARFLERCHFVSEPVASMEEQEFWVPELLDDWSCEDHNCGVDQVHFSTADESTQFILPRLDARYDWLPSPSHALTNRSYPIAFSGTGCDLSSDVKGTVAVVKSGSCSYFDKVTNMEKSGAVAILVMQDERGSKFEDMNCEGNECSKLVDIPASMIPTLESRKDLKVQFLTKKSENFFAGIDEDGSLSEVGWFLHPSFRYLNWQADWFNYKKELTLNLSREAFELEIFNNKSVMAGDKGVTVNYTFEDASVLKKYNHLDLDMSLSCQGLTDADCPHWDRTIQLFMTCNGVFNGVEIGRWISPFKRRIGRWLTDISPLIATLPESQSTCSFTFTGALSGEFWMPRLSLRFSRSDETALRPVSAHPWIGGTFSFDKDYNSRFRPFKFRLDGRYESVKIYSVITGHGSDENYCAEFCVTSHHFVVNQKHLYNETFFNAGTDLGCAEQTRSGVEPNEHGTWLYGRNGWCDGQEVDPWLVDITDQLRVDEVNVLNYFGLFQGAEPSPQQEGAVITIQVFVVFYA